MAADDLVDLVDDACTKTIAKTKATGLFLTFLDSPGLGWTSPDSEHSVRSMPNTFLAFPQPLPPKPALNQNDGYREHRGAVRGWRLGPLGPLGPPTR